MKTITIVVVDSSELFCSYIISRLNSSGFNSIAVADVDQLLATLAVPTVEPDICFVNITLVDENKVARIRRRRP